MSKKTNHRKIAATLLLLAVCSVILFIITLTIAIVTVKDTHANNNEAKPVIVTNEDYKAEKTTTSFTIRMKAEDADGNGLTYTLYASSSKNGPYTQVGTTTGNSGELKTIKVQGISTAPLTEYTSYWWYIEVSDGVNKVESDIQVLNTYCPGTITCNATLCEGGIITGYDEIYEYDNCGGDISGDDETR